MKMPPEFLRCVGSWGERLPKKQVIRRSTMSRTTLAIYLFYKELRLWQVGGSLQVLPWHHSRVSRAGQGRLSAH